MDAPRDGDLPNSTMQPGTWPEVAAATSGVDITIANSLHTLPLGEPGRIQDLTTAFVRFALSSRREVTMRPTFDDRESDSGLLIGGLILKSAMEIWDTYAQTTDPNSFVRRTRCGYVRAEPRWTGRLPIPDEAVTELNCVLPQNTFERRDGRRKS